MKVPDRRAHWPRVTCAVVRRQVEALEAEDAVRRAATDPVLLQYKQVADIGVLLDKQQRCVRRPAV